MRELRQFFMKKLRKGNGVWWALSYTWLHWRWMRIRDNEDRYLKWLNRP